MRGPPGRFSRPAHPAAALEELEDLTSGTWFTAAIPARGAKGLCWVGSRDSEGFNAAVTDSAGINAAFAEAVPAADISKRSPPRLTDPSPLGSRQAFASARVLRSSPLW